MILYSSASVCIPIPGFEFPHTSPPLTSLPLPQTHAILHLSSQIPFPKIPGVTPVCQAQLQHVIRRCLDPKYQNRITVDELLAHPFLKPDANGGSNAPGVPTLHDLESALSYVGAAFRDLGMSGPLGAAADAMRTKEHCDMIAKALHTRLQKLANPGSDEAAAGGAS